MAANSKPTLLTPEGKQKLEEELEYLRTVRRQQIAERIRRAREEGDLRENAEYEEAKREQAFIEGRIQELEQLLKHVRIISKDENAQGVVQLGSTVRVQEEGGPEEEFTVVGSAEADPANGRISNESPLGRALLGRRAGERIQVQTPDGEVTFVILSVE